MDNQKPDITAPNAAMPNSFNCDFILARIKSIISTNTNWNEIRYEYADLNSIYLGYFLYLALIPAVASFISYVFLGEFQLGFLMAVCQLVIALLFTHVTAYLLTVLAGKYYQFNLDLITALKLLTYSFTPLYLAGAFTLFPFLSFFVFLLGLGFSVYKLYEALPVMTDVQKEKHIPFLGACLGVQLAAGIIFSVAVTALAFVNL